MAANALLPTDKLRFGSFRPILGQLAHEEPRGRREGVRRYGRSRRTLKAGRTRAANTVGCRRSIFVGREPAFPLAKGGGSESSPAPPWTHLELLQHKPRCVRTAPTH